MKILTVDARTTNQSDVALPFDTDAEVVAAWEWLLRNQYLKDFSYRPWAEGVDFGRAFIQAQLASHQQQDGTPMAALDAMHVRAVVAHLWQADLHHSVREVIDPAK